MIKGKQASHNAGLAEQSGVFKHQCILPHKLEDPLEIGLNLLHSFLQQPAVGPHAHVRHSVHRHQGLHKPAQWVQRGVTGLGSSSKGAGQ